MNTEKKSKKKLLIVIIVVLAVILAEVIAIIAGVMYYNSPEQRFSRLITAGQKYLSEEDYEEAAAAFSEALTIDPKNETAVEGAITAYTSWGNEVSAEEHYKEAIAILDDALSVLPDNEDILKVMADTYLTWGGIYADAKEFSKAKQIYQEGYDKTEDDRLKEALINIEELVRIEAVYDEMEAFCEELALNCHNHDYTSAYKMMDSETYKTILTELNNGGIENSIMIYTSYSQVGFYPVESDIYGNYMVYCGGYDDNKRSGNGIWLGYNAGEHYYAIGDWNNDSPNGQQEVHEWYGELSPDVSERVLSGSVIDGLWDGTVSWGFTLEDRFQSWNVSFNSGFPIEKETSYDDGTYYIWSENENGELGSEVATTKPLGIIGWGSPDE